MKTTLKLDGKFNVLSGYVHKSLVSTLVSEYNLKKVTDKVYSDSLYIEDGTIFIIDITNEFNKNWEIYAYNEVWDKKLLNHFVVEK